MKAIFSTMIALAVEIQTRLTVVSISKNVCTYKNVYQKCDNKCPDSALVSVSVSDILFFN